MERAHPLCDCPYFYRLDGNKVEFRHEFVSMSTRSQIFLERASEFFLKIIIVNLFDSPQLGFLFSSILYASIFFFNFFCYFFDASRDTTMGEHCSIEMFLKIYNWNLWYELGQIDSISFL